MILGHNWGTVRELKVAHARGWDGRANGCFGPSWRGILLYLKVAEVGETDCFFTNLLVGLQPRHATGRMVVTDEFESQCRAFLCKQIEIVRPRLVATLGKFAADQFRRSECPTPSVALIHPGYACAPYNAGRCESIVKMDGAKLRAALNALDHK
jgi:uracil-DNA glycosylase family 4